MTLRTYTDDILVWAEQQASLLRRLAAGERVNEAVDWPHLIEEVEDLGRAELHAVESLLRQAMLHLIKLAAGAEQPAAHWRAETLGFLADAAARFTPSMRQKLDLDRIFRLANRQAEAAGIAVSVKTCPWELDELLGEQADLEGLIKALA